MPPPFIYISFMQSKLFIPLFAIGTLALASCSKLGELSADNFTVSPSPMEEAGGKVSVIINGRFPEKYMKKKAVVTVTPEIRYAQNAAKGQSATFQGEKVQGNNQEISYNLGGNYTLRNTFAYKDEMQESELYLTFDAYLGNKKVELPAVKVADGVIATSTLLSKTIGSAHSEYATDSYQYAIKQTRQAQIKYLINQANIRNSELSATSIQDFIRTLRDIKADQKGYMLENIEVSAYASPEGSTKFNTELAQKREHSSKGYVNSQLKAANLDAEVDSKYTAEDWEGFQQLVSNSNIQDKDVILRVLSMYPDPEEREKQIRNLSAGFQELADEILPELRRARMTINYNIIGRSDDEIEEQYKTDASRLSVEELLYAATFYDDVNKQKDIYTTTTKYYPNDYRAYNNLAAIAYSEGDLATAQNYLAKAAAKSDNATEVKANQALAALAAGNAEEAQNYLLKAPTAKNYNEVLGNLLISQGSYAQAAQSLKGVKSNSAALAQILSKDYSAASTTLKSVEHPDGTTSYLKAILAARTNNDSEALSALKDAFQKDATLKARAKKDLEFVTLFNDNTFQSLVK